MSRRPPIAALFPSTTLSRSHHTVFLAKDYRRNLAEIEAGQAPDAPSFYVQNACVTDPALAPPGHSTLYVRSEEHTSELQSHVNLVCRLLLEKKKKIRATSCP